MPVQYPFSAVVGCESDRLDDMGLALVLTTISPEIGGVLIRGEKGTAKSTTVRALASVLPPIQVYAGDRFSVDPGDGRADGSVSTPDGVIDPDTEIVSRAVGLVELPVGATEDRVLGSLHLEGALSRGLVEYEPGLLARAHRGILYVDEVNLLHDHLVDLLLDAAAMGRASIERDGVSVEHAARFVLIGTMNPEEGELRPQLLDRFGLTVEVAAPRDPALRVEVVRRRLAYDTDPAGFAAGYQLAERDLRARIGTAQAQVGAVVLSERALLKIAEICAAFEVDGLRADIVTARTALAHAAWEGRTAVERADIRRAALLALPHRRRRNPFDAPGLDEELLDRILGDDEIPPDPPGPDDEPDESEPDESEPGESEPSDQQAPAAPDPADAPADEAVAEQPQAPPTPEPESTDPGHDDADDSAPQSQVAAAAPYRPRLLKVAGTGEGVAGRRSRAIASSGRRIGAKRPDGRSGSLHLVETLMAAAGRQGQRQRVGRRVRMLPEDIRTAVREGREANLIVFCVDASGSMAARRRMTQVKTAVLSLLLDAYRRRDKVCLITFRGAGVEVALPPTHSVDIAASRLDEIAAGGRSPVAEGLLEAARLLIRERRRDPHLRPLLVVVTDGRATGGVDPVGRAHRAAEYLAGMDITTVVIDGETGPLRLGLARTLAGHLRAEHLPVSEVTAEALAGTVRARTEGVA